MPNIIELQDLSLPELQIYASLKHRSMEDPDLFLAESAKVIEYALTAGCRPHSFLMERRCIQAQAKELICDCACPVYTADRAVLANLTGFPLDRGFLCAMSRPPQRSMEQVCLNARRVAVLDRLEDPTDLGAIFRSAAALGIDALVLTQRCPDPLYRRCVRVSMGTVFQVPWARAPAGALAQLRQLGFQILVLTDHGTSVEDPSLASAEKLAVLLSDHPQAYADVPAICLPLPSHAETLNMAAASAVAFWQLRAH